MRDLPPRLLAVLLGVAIAPSTARGGVNRWTRGTPNWGPEFVRSVALSPREPGLVLAGSPNGMFRSSDDGVTWSLARVPFTYWGPTLITFAAASRRVAYAKDEELGVIRTVDGGAFWELAGSGLPQSGSSLESLAADPFDPSVVYAGFIDGLIFRSMDGATSWTRVFDTGQLGTINALAPDPHHPGVVYVSSNGLGILRSLDGGVTWNPIGELDPPVAWGVLADPAEDGLLYAITDAGIVRSLDGGETWELRSGDFHPWTLAADPSDGAVLYASVTDYDAQRFGVYKSTDGGGSWSPSLVQEPAEVSGSIAVDPNDPRAVWTGGAQLWKSLDGGGHWLAVGAGSAAISGVPLLADTTDPNVVLAGGGAEPLWRSADRGRTWTRAAEETGLLPLGLLQQASAGTIFASDGLRLFQSANGGATWTELPLQAAYPIMVLDPDRPGVLYSATSYCGLSCRLPNFVYRSTDSGASWIQIGEVQGATFLGLTPRPQSGELFANVNLKLWRATVSGDLAPLPGSPEVFTLEFAHSDPSIAYALGSAVYRSANGGLGWQPTAGAGLPAPPFYRLAIDPSNPSVVYVTADGVYRSADAGEHFERLSDACLEESFIASLAVSADGQTVYLATGHAIYQYTLCEDCPPARPAPRVVDRSAR